MRASGRITHRGCAQSCELCVHMHTPHAHAHATPANCARARECELCSQYTIVRIRRARCRRRRARSGARRRLGRAGRRAKRPPRPRRHRTAPRPRSQWRYRAALPLALPLRALVRPQRPFRRSRSRPKMRSRRRRSRRLGRRHPCGPGRRHGPQRRHGRQRTLQRRRQSLLSPRNPLVGAPRPYSYVKWPHAKAVRAQQSAKYTFFHAINIQVQGGLQTAFNFAFPQ